MLSAEVKASAAKSDARVPAFLLETRNLDNYRPWMKHVREWARSKGSRVMELHLIGEHMYL